jgi:mycofactocin system creatininase family protein
VGRPAAALADMRWPEVDSGPRRVLVVPVGSLEQHGPHLPLDTDTRIAVAVARGACASVSGVALAPAIGIGASGEHRDFPGTLSIGTAALTGCLIELGRHSSLHWRAMLLVNGHGGNTEALRTVTARLGYEGRVCRIWHATLPGGDAHAGRLETSIMLALAPQAVLMSAAAAGCRLPIEELMPALRAGGVRAVSPNGVLGDPCGASAAEGRKLLTELTSGLRETLQRLLNNMTEGEPVPNGQTASPCSPGASR